MFSSPRTSNPFEPKVVENKYYAPGVGFILERKVKGPKQVLELVDIR